MNMKAALMYGPNDIRVEETPKPACPKDGLILKIMAVGLCGSDIRNLTTDSRKGDYPFIYGHEIVGVVESQFVQRGKKHAEISLVYRLEIQGLPPPGSQVPAKEDWIEFVWWPIGRLSEAGLLPTEMAKYAVQS